MKVKIDELMAIGHGLGRTQKQLQEKAEESRAQFISTELDLAVTFCKIAESTSDEGRALRSIRNAEQAYEVATRFLETAQSLPLTIKKDAYIKAAQVERALSCLKEEFPKSSGA